VCQHETPVLVALVLSVLRCAPTSDNEQLQRVLICNYSLVMVVFATIVM